MFQIPTAAFLSYDGYHHHIGVNTWAGDVLHDENYLGLHQVTLLLPENQQKSLSFSDEVT